MKFIEQVRATLDRFGSMSLDQMQQQGDEMIRRVGEPEVPFEETEPEEDDEDLDEEDLDEEDEDEDEDEDEE